jgi:hypothetical protein
MKKRIVLLGRPWHEPDSPRPSSIPWTADMASSSHKIPVPGGLIRQDRHGRQTTAKISARPGGEKMRLRFRAYASRRRSQSRRQRAVESPSKAFHRNFGRHLQLQRSVSHRNRPSCCVRPTSTKSSCSLHGGLWRQSFLLVVAIRIRLLGIPLERDEASTYAGQLMLRHPSIQTRV